MNLHSKNEFISPNEKLTNFYNDLIANNIEQFFEMLDKNQVQHNCLSPKMEKIIKNRRRKFNKKEVREAIKTIFSFLKDYKYILIFLIFSTIIITTLNALATFGLKTMTELVALSQTHPIDFATHGFNPNIIDINGHNFNVMSAYGIVLIVFYFITALFSWAQTWICVKIVQKMGYRIRQKLFKKIQKLPVKYFDQHSSGDLMSKFTNDINTVTDALSQNTATLLNGIFMALAMLISMFLMSSFLALITIGLLPFIFIPIAIITRKSQPMFKRTQVTLGEMNGFIEEMVSGQSVITLFNNEEKTYKSFEKVNKKLNDAAKGSQAMSALIFPYTNFFINSLTMLITVIGIIFVIKGIDFGGVNIPNPSGIQMPMPKIPHLAHLPSIVNKMLPNTQTMVRFMSGIAVIASFSMMARGFLQPFSQAGNVANLLQMALAGANRSFGVFKEDNEMTSLENTILKIASNRHQNRVALEVKKVEELEQEQKLNDAEKKAIEEELKNEETDKVSLDHLQFKTVNGSARIENLNFSYVKDKQILHDITFDVKEGQTIAIVGPTGSGKSTFINLLTKFYDVTDGDIILGDDEQVSIKEVIKYSMRNNVSIVLQDTFLFNVSIKENISYGNMNASDEEIIAAAKTANAHNFIMQLPNGYDTVLTDNGESLSQGQRQLLAIARAALAPASILVLDEATSSIDTKTELQIQSAMLNLMKNKTSFVIAHRLSTIQNADVILVLKDGHILEKGTHQELLKQKGFYAELFNSQFAED